MKKRILFLALLAVTLLLTGCETEPFGVLEITKGSKSIGTGETIGIKLIVHDANSTDLTYKWKSGKGEGFSESKDGYKEFSYANAGTYTIEAYAYDGVVYTAIVKETITVGSGGGVDPGPGNYPLHTNIKATTFWVGEVGSDDNHNISNVPSAWDSDWGKDFGIEDHPTWLSRDGDYIPTHSGYLKKENPYYFALPFNDFGELIFDGEHKQANVANLKSEYYKLYDNEYGRDIVNTNRMTGDRKTDVNRIPWKNSESSWSGKSMVKGRWIKVRHNNGAWVYAQWLDAGPYHYDDVDYLFPTGNTPARPRNEGSSTGEDPYAGIDLSPSVMLKMGLKLNDWGITLNGGIDWAFVDYNDVPDGPWKRYQSDNRTNWN